MLLGLLFAMIFGSGGESEFATSIPNIQKEVKQNITDKARRDSVLVLIKDYESAINDYLKEKDRLQEKVNKVSGDRTVSSEELLKQYEEYHRARISLITSLIDYRLMFQEQITEKELLGVIEKAIKTTSEQKLKQQEQEEQTEDNLNLALNEIHDILIRNIQDPGMAGRITEGFLDFERTVYDYLDISRDMKEQRKAMLLNINATREQMEAAYEQSNQIRYKAAKDFAVLRDQVIKNTTESEWKDINKELKAFFKS